MLIAKLFGFGAKAKSELQATCGEYFASFNHEASCKSWARSAVGHECDVRRPATDPLLHYDTTPLLRPRLLAQMPSP
jgi:hypothetical protein